MTGIRQKTPCPLCSNPTRTTVRGALYKHPGQDGRPCLASRVVLRAAERMRDNRNAGRHPQHNADGTRLDVCHVCGRELHGWPLNRRPACSRADAVHCIRPLPDEGAR